MNIRDNIISWDDDYDWKDRGEEWSEPWGNSSAQWFNLIYPRIHAYLPANRILEIAIGHGRWTNHLKNYSSELIGIDLAEKCVEYCRKRFNNDKKLVFYQNNGLDLSMVADASVDFVFSFDSLVHVDLPTMKSYLFEIKRVLKSGDVAFIHHSNLLDCPKVEGLKEHVRASDVSHQNVKEFSDSIGLNCIIQELVNWRNPESFLIDCFSTFVKDNSGRSPEYKLFRNNKFMEQAQYIKILSSYYK